MTKQKKRRVWSAEEKRLICGQARLPGVSVSQVARRYDVNANLVFTCELAPVSTGHLGIGKEA